MSDGYGLALTMVWFEETAMASKIPVGGDSKVTAERLFQDVESAADLGPGRARTIAVWLGLFVCAILVSQFGRPSRAREAEFMRGAAKVSAFGKVSGGSGAPGGEASAVKNSAALLADEKELVPAVYTNPKYGLAWQYPRNFVLRKGANAGLDLSGHYSAATAFVREGGVTLASVIIPRRVYPGTDFLEGSLTARVSNKMTAEACAEFRKLGVGQNDAQDFPASEIMVGSTEFVTAEAQVERDSLSEAETREKFFHVHENAVCYEFAMRVTGGTGEQKSSMRHVGADEVFERLTEILTSVTIVPVRDAAESAVPEVVAPERHK
jgi:hypothetical protein